MVEKTTLAIEFGGLFSQVRAKRLHGVARHDFNSYGSRRGNHEVMIRGTFANIRLRNQVAPGTEGGFTRDFTLTDAPVTTVYDAAQNYGALGTPLVVLAGKE